MSNDRPTPALAEFPWHADHLGSGGPSCLYSAGGWYIADVFADDVAEFIVAACNAHAPKLERHITTVGGLERHPTMQGNLLDTSTDLLPCPFCGHESGYRGPVHVQAGFNTSDEWIRAECSNTSCGVATPFHYRTREAAREAWNCRCAT